MRIAEYLESGRPGPTGNLALRLRVLRRSVIAEDIIRLDLGRPDGEPLPAWSPGAHINLNIGETLQRQYSLIGELDDRSTWSIAVQRDRSSRGGSAWLHRNARVGTELDVTHMRNNFHLESAKNYLLVAGGIGITPLLPMVRTIRATGARWRMLYGGRSRSSMAFLRDLDTQPEVEICVEAEHGRPDLKAFLGDPTSDTLIYACGPVGMLAALHEATAAWPSNTVHVEQFTATQSDGVDTAFTVELARSEQTLTVEPGVTILQTVREAGVDAMSSCEEGTCGTCETRVLSGVPDHRDAVLSPEDRESNKYMMICVSRSQGERLVLDL